MTAIKPQYIRALIYCRVSSQQQVTTGHGLDSQEQRCIQRAKDLDLEIVKIFPDGAISGGLFARPAMNKLMAFLDENSNEKFVVIFDDLKRFARDVQVHLQLKSELVTKRGVRLECLNFNFEDSPTGRFVEIVMAGAAQLEREQNREQVINKMKSRLETGHWPFCPPRGLRQVKGILQPVEPFAAIYKAAIEGYKDFTLSNHEAVRKFIVGQYHNHGIESSLSLHGVKEILTEPLYAGWVEYKPWGIERMKGTHDGIITHSTYLAVQERLRAAAKPRLRSDYSLDFSLRRYIICSECQKPFTAAWFRGKTKMYGYYVCHGCNMRVSKVKIDDNFITILKEKAPLPEAIRGAEVVLEDIWKTRKDMKQLDYKDMTQNILSFLQNPVKHWESPHILERKCLLDMYFDGPLIYDKNEGQLNTKSPLIFEVIRGQVPYEINLVEGGQNILNSLCEYIRQFAPRASLYI